MSLVIPSGPDAFLGFKSSIMFDFVLPKVSIVNGFDRLLCQSSDVFVMICVVLRIVFWNESRLSKLWSVTSCRKSTSMSLRRRKLFRSPVLVGDCTPFMLCVAMVVMGIVGNGGSMRFHFILCLFC
jgi:hypothetical protein